MSKQVKRRRGTTAEHSVFLGAEAELTIDTTVNTVVVHDGSLTGGYPLCKADLSNADLVNKIGIAELNVADGINGQLLSTNGSGSLVFANPGGVIPNSVGVVELDVADGTAGQFLTTNGAGVLSFTSVSTAVIATAVGGDLSGTVGNAQIVDNAVDSNAIAANSVGITELDVLDGSPGQVLATNGSGDLSFVTAATGGGSGGSSTFIEDEFTGNGSTTTFTLSTAAPMEECILLFIDGVSQPTSAYTLPTSTSINLSSAPTTGANIKVLHLGIASGILDDSITTNKLADNSITNAKMADDAIGIAELSATGTADATTFLRGDNTWTTDGSSLTNLPATAYDIGWIAGYDKDLIAEALVDATYGHMIMARTGTFLGCVGSLDSSGTLEVIIEKNGASIYSSNPSFSSGTVMTDGTLSDTSFASGDKITFKVTGYSSGTGLRLTLKCMV